MKTEENYPLSKLTTFHIGGTALFFVEIENESELLEALDLAKKKNLPVLIMGGGSNLLVSDQGFAGLVIKISIKGKDVVSENENEAYLKVGSGEIWDEVVEHTVAKNLWGVENLSGIPGLSGAIPVQNVGAYGQEASLVVEKVEVLDLQTLEKKSIANTECGFGYRKSNFNTAWKNKYAILSITFKLSKQPKSNLSYADVKKYFEGKTNPSQAEIRTAVISIRKNKFPDINILGNAGSCFKNPILDNKQFDSLQENIKKNFDQTVLDKLLETRQRLQGKVPAAFLIDICGLKGSVVGKAKLWDRQPLVIVNEGNAKATDVVELFNKVKSEVLTKTGIELEPEPEFVGFN